MRTRLCVLAFFAAGCSPAQEVWLGPAPVAPTVILQPEQAPLAQPLLGGLTGFYDTTNREAIRALYNSTWVPSRSATIGWTGSATGCLEGTISQQWKDAVVTGLNFLRNLAGVPGTVTLDSGGIPAPLTLGLGNSAKAQKAALMFSVNQQLSRNPPEFWVCYSADGATAAGNSNVCVQKFNVTPGCLDLHMDDSGSGNEAVGHRRWILYPQTQIFGDGDVPVNGANSSGNALWVFDANLGGPRPPTREPFVAWPPPGYFPYQLIPNRWSFSYPNASFSGASVTLTKGGASVPLILESVQNGFGENTIVFYAIGADNTRPTVPQKPAADTPYTVAINNVTVSGIQQNFTYNVTAFDPAVGSSAPPVFTGPSRFVPITPCRIVDTRLANGPFGGPVIAAGQSRDFVIPNSTCNVPSAATAYSLNTAVVPRGILGFITLWPSGQAQPLVATLTSLDGRVTSNAAIVPAGVAGAISLYATDNTDVIIDVNGYFLPATSTGGLSYYPVTPCRVADTRNGSGALGGPRLASNQTRSFPINGSSCGIPASSQAYALNFVAVPSGPLGFMTAWPTGQPRPLASSLNALTGAITANAVLVPAGTNGEVSVFTSNDTDLVIDISGYFAPPGAGGLSFYNLNPCRVDDTRLPPNHGPFAGTRDINVTGSPCNVPVAAKAYVLNATVVPAGIMGFLTLWPEGQPQPLAANLSAVDGAITSNMAITSTTTGQVSAFVLNSTNLILDISGYYAP